MIINSIIAGAASTQPVNYLETIFINGMANYFNNLLYVDYNNKDKRRGLWMTSGDKSAAIYGAPTMAICPVYPMSVPANATKVTVTTNPANEYDIFHVKIVNGDYVFISTSGWMTNSTEYTLLESGGYIGISLRANSSNENYTESNSPHLINVIFA